MTKPHQLLHSFRVHPTIGERLVHLAERRGIGGDCQREWRGTYEGGIMVPAL
jgi:hypothetical protein